MTVIKSVAIVFHRLGPYHAARLKEAARLQPVVAIELSAESAEYEWDKLSGNVGFEQVTLFRSGDSREAPISDVYSRLSKTLEQINPGVVVVPGWSDKGALAAIGFSGRNHVPVLLMSESSQYDEQRIWWREWLKRRVVGLCSAAVVGGRMHAEYMARLGMSGDRVFLGYDSVDNRYFSEQTKQIKRSEIRRGCELPEKFFLASARFIAKKNLPRLLEAYALYTWKAETLKDAKPVTEVWELVLLGEGPLRSSLNSQLSTLNLRGHVHMPGFKQYTDLPVYYGLASAFVHASTTEQWGLVVNEAMASGLPILVSNRCGCVPDLVREGVNGFTFDPYNIEQLAELMLKVSSSNFPLSAFGKESQCIIANWGPERFASGLKAAVDKAIEVGPKRATCFDRLLLWALMHRKS